MQLKTKYIPSLIFPYDDVAHAAKVQAKLYSKNPILAIFPKMSPNWGVLERTFCNFDFFSIDNGKICFNSKLYDQMSLEFDFVCKNLAPEFLTKYIKEEVFSQKFFSLIKKFKPPHASLNLLGPCSAFQKFEKNEHSEFSIENKKCRDILVNSIIIKALAYITKVKEISLSTFPLIILEEPLLYRAGILHRMNENITPEIITEMFAQIALKVREAGGYTVVQSMEKCDWRIPINANVDMISFGAYSNPYNLTVFYKPIMKFITNGGKINWAIIRANNENIIKNLNQMHLSKLLVDRFEILASKGISPKDIYNSATISIQDSVGSIPLIHAEKVMILLSQLAENIPMPSL